MLHSLVDSANTLFKVLSDDFLWQTFCDSKKKTEICEKEIMETIYTF